MLDDYDFQKEWKECLHYARLAQKWKPFTPAQEKKVLEEYYSDNISYKRKKQLKDEIVLRNLRFIIKKAKHPQYVGKGIPLIELIQEGIIGFIYSLDFKYDIKTGNKLLTNAGWWVIQRLGRSVETKSRLVKLPLHVLAKINKIRTVYRDCIANDPSGEKPGAEEVSIIIKDRWNLDISPEEVEELGRYQYVHGSLDETVDDGQASMLDFITVNGADEIHEEVERSANKDYINELLSQLEPLEAKLITWKFGLIDLNTKRTTKEMATIMGLPVDAYKQLENQTMSKLRSLADIDRVCW